MSYFDFNDGKYHNVCNCCRKFEITDGSVICEDCNDDLMHKFAKFLCGLTEEEIIVLDDSLDGRSIRDFI